VAGTHQDGDHLGVLVVKMVTLDVSGSKTRSRKSGCSSPALWIGEWTPRPVQIAVEG
jgi:hypothetical protein